MNSIKALVIQKAPYENYDQSGSCPICYEIMDPFLDHRLGVAVIHDGQNGSKHPMHANCLKTALCSQSQFDRDSRTGSCPICRAKISWPAPPGSFEKTVQISTFIMLAATAHAFVSSLTERPMLVSATPGVLSSLISLNSFFIERRELGLEYSLRVEIAKKIATSVALIGVPLAASFTASQITDSRISNSFITATFGTIALMPLVISFLNPLSKIPDLD